MSLPDDLEHRLRRHRAPENDDPPVRRSAVAAVLRALGPHSEVLLMRRVEHPQDPWSGQISMPGGRHEQHDPDLVTTAVRETREEVGLDLARTAELLCRLAPQQARARAGLLAMDVTPFVFRFDGGSEPRPSDEAAEVFWFPLGRAATGELDAEFPYEKDGVVHRLPCWRHEERIVWGMTYRMLSGLVTVARSDRA